jgi:hypothetical protein
MRSPKLLKSVLVLSAVALLSSVALLSIAPRLRADDAAAPVGFPTAVKEHELLRKFVGEWESECQGTFGEGQPAFTCQGALTSRMLGDFWVVNESTTEMMGVKVTAVQTIGFDPATGKYVGTWVDSMTSHMWKYEGTLDEATQTLTLEAEGPNFMAEGKTAMFRDIYQFKTPDQIDASSQMQADDGTWTTFMSGSMRRKK